VRVVAADIGRFHHIEGSFPTLWHEFAIGLAVYWRLNVPAPAWAKRCVELGLAALFLEGLTGALRGPVAYSTAAAAALGLVLIALRPWDERAECLAWLRPLHACGRRCYSIYLVHLPVCTVGCLWLVERGMTGFWARTLIMIPAVSIAAVAASWLFFWGVERHFLNPSIVVPDPARRTIDVAPLAGETASAPEVLATD
jgi:peptidoglycan/LPS O-acetylase OafA/YrhL